MFISGSKRERHTHTDRETGRDRERERERERERGGGGLKETEGGAGKEREKESEDTNCRSSLIALEIPLDNKIIKSWNMFIAESQLHMSILRSFGTALIYLQTLQIFKKIFSKIIK